MTTYYVSDTRRGSGISQLAKQHDLCLQEIQNLEKQTKEETEQVIRGLVNMEEKTRELCNCMTKEQN